jgi:hypothetical protein
MPLAGGETGRHAGLYKPSPDVVTTDLGSEVILLDPRNGGMFSLNEVGRRVWLALPTHSSRRLAELISSEFDVLPALAEADIERLLSALESAGLVERQDGAG